MAAVAIIILLVYGLLVFYIGWSGWRWMKPRGSKAIKIAYAIVIAVLATSFLLARIGEGSVLFQIAGAYWIAVFSLLLMALPVVHLALLLLRLTRVPRHRAEKTAGFLVLGALLVWLVYGSFNAYSPVVRNYELTMDKQVEGMEQLNIVMAADMHFSVLSGKAHAERLVAGINALEPDLVLLPGDIVDDTLGPYFDKGIDRILTGINAKYGVYAVLGNHDRTSEMEELIAALEGGGMTVLYDEVVTVADSLTLVGRKDHTDRNRASVAELVADVDFTQPVIMLDHQPYDLDIARDNGIDLVVSGHTHYGQIAPANLITGMLFENDWGYLQKDQLHSIVTSGFGFWGPPIRIGSRAEIVQIQVSFAP